VRVSILVAVLLGTLLLPPTLDIRVAGLSWATLYWVLLIAAGCGLAASGITRSRWPLLLLLIIPAYTLIQPVQSGGASRVAVLLPGLAFVSLLSAVLALRPDPAALARRLVLVSLPVHILALVQGVINSWPVIDPLSLPEFTSAAYFGRAAGTLGHPIAYGTLAGVSVLLAFLTPSLGRRIRYGAIILGLAGLLASGSRSAMIPIAGLILLILLGRAARWLRRPTATRRGVTRLALLCILAGPISAGGYAVVTQLDTSRYQNVQESFSYRYRTMQWQAAWRLISQDAQTLTWGQGAGASTLLLSTRRLIPIWGPRTFDNSAVTLVFDFGLLGVGVMATGLLALILSPGPAAGRAVLAFLAGNALFFDAFLWPSFLALLVIGVALRLPPTRIARSTKVLLHGRPLPRIVWRRSHSRAR